MLDTMKQYADECAEMAEKIQNLLIKDIFRRDICIRYNPKRGAYISLDDYNDDVIVMRNDEIRRDLTHPQQTAFLVKNLSNKPFFAV